MIYSLPKDLKTAQIQSVDSIITALSETNSKRLSINFLFEGLKINPLSINIAKLLSYKYPNILILVSDQGNASLLKRDYPDFSKSIYTYSEYIKNNKQIGLFDLSVALSPLAFDYEEYQQLCKLIEHPIIMINGSLEDTAIGIGSLGRERRRNFIQSWNKVYWLQPLTNGALMKNYPNDWQLYSLSKEGYSILETFTNKPDQETITSLL